MKHDMIIAGVGGQGVLSIASLIAATALDEGLFVKQSEVHGMAQRGGAVVAHLRLSDEPIHSELIPKGGADMILSLEPLESLRSLDYLAADGWLVTSGDAVENISTYPDVEDLIAKIKSRERSVVVDADALAREAGSQRAVNMVMIGAASSHLPLSEAAIGRTIRTKFASKGDDVVKINIEALRAGRGAVSAT